MTVDAVFKSRVVRALTTIEQMLRDRGESVVALARLDDDMIRKKLSDSTDNFVIFDAGLRDAVFFLNKLKTADISKVASSIADEQRRARAILVPIDALMTIHARAVSANFGPSCEIFTLASLSFNISRSELVPRHDVIPRSDHAKLRRELMITSLAQLPLIESSDPMAKYVAARPGDVVKVTRMHPSAGTQVAFRYCRK